MSTSDHASQAWMTQDPSTVKTPEFGWYQPRYLLPASGSREARYFFPPILEALEGSSSTAAAVEDRDSSSPLDVVDKLDAVARAQAERRKAAHLDWQTVTPLEELWNGPPLDSKVGPASDYARLLEKIEEGI